MRLTIATCLTRRLSVSGENAVCANNIEQRMVPKIITDTKMPLLPDRQLVAMKLLVCSMFLYRKEKKIRRFF